MTPAWNCRAGSHLSDAAETTIRRWPVRGHALQGHGAEIGAAWGAFIGECLANPAHRIDESRPPFEHYPRGAVFDAKHRRVRLRALPAGARERVCAEYLSIASRDARRHSGARRSSSPPRRASSARPTTPPRRSKARCAAPSAWIRSCIRDGTYFVHGGGGRHRGLRWLEPAPHAVRQRRARRSRCRRARSCRRCRARSARSSFTRISRGAASARDCSNAANTTPSRTASRASSSWARCRACGCTRRAAIVAAAPVDWPLDDGLTIQFVPMSKTAAPSRSRSNAPRATMRPPFSSCRSSPTSPRRGSMTTGHCRRSCRRSIRCATNSRRRWC